MAQIIDILTDLVLIRRECEWVEWGTPYSRLKFEDCCYETFLNVAVKTFYPQTVLYICASGIIQTLFIDIYEKNKAKERKKIIFFWRIYLLPLLLKVVYN